MKYNLRAIMCRACEIRRGTRHTFVTALKLAWAEAKGERAYTFNPVSYTRLDVYKRQGQHAFRAAGALGDPGLCQCAQL